MLKPLSTASAPQAIGPYSQAVEVPSAGLMFLSGQIPLDPDTMELVGDNIEAQTRQVLKNLTEVLAAGGCKLSDVIKTTIYLKNMGDFAAVNEIYASFFGEHKPARATVEVSRLPKDVKVEIEAIAELG